MILGSYQFLRTLEDTGLFWQESVQNWECEKYLFSFPHLLFCALLFVVGGGAAGGLEEESVCCPI